jgi:hypothetical protein
MSFDLLIRNFFILHYNPKTSADPRFLVLCDNDGSFVNNVVLSSSVANVITGTFNSNTENDNESNDPVKAYGCYAEGNIIWQFDQATIRSAGTITLTRPDISGLDIAVYFECLDRLYPDFCRISKSILDFGLKNVTKQAQKDFTLFRRADQLSDIFHWRWIIQNYGTGLIKYSDETTIHGNPEHIANMKDNFGYELSLSLVIDRLMHDRLSCPFLDEIPICTSNLKNDTCLKNPFLIKTDFSGKECLYRCGFMLTGMSERIDFNS